MSHELHGQAADSCRRKLCALSRREVARWHAVNPPSDENTSGRQILVNCRYYDAELVTRAPIELVEAADMIGFDLEVEFVKQASTNLVKDSDDNVGVAANLELFLRELKQPTSAV
eukprot:CAMPEP_0115846806 /NCGR_PEP_ID=MMETSP0287-20121206/10051_1 /TAXON_ID=412157 /ORGANISM="Chrysochromulina rotalis, Strain UIO044" /LENGTH=114 /DNA_ID=CAMNT_0003300609 /DNA_START=1204 /DNA_END=1548 /DNA_ORIENTATION=-